MAHCNDTERSATGLLDDTTVVAARYEAIIAPATCAAPLLHHVTLCVVCL